MPSSEKRCTWKGCSELGVHEQLDRNGDVWSVLCTTYHAELDAAVSGGNVKTMLRTWVLAQGGAKAAASRTVTPAMQNALDRFWTALRKRERR